MSRKYQLYSEEFKLSVIRDYYSSGMSKRACVRKYGLSCDALLRSWLRKHENVENVVPLQSEPIDEEMANRSKDDYKHENAQLKKRIRELEKALDRCEASYRPQHSQLQLSLIQRTHLPREVIPAWLAGHRGCSFPYSYSF